MFADAFTNDDYYLSTSASFPRMPPDTINDALNRNWLTDGLDSSMGCLNKCLSVLNFINRARSQTGGPSIKIQISRIFHQGPPVHPNGLYRPSIQSHSQ